jgi:hypothetical protein
VHLLRAKKVGMVYEETFLRNFRFYAKTLTKLHDLTVIAKCFSFIASANINPDSTRPDIISSRAAHASNMVRTFHHAPHMHRI